MQPGNYRIQIEYNAYILIMHKRFSIIFYNYIKNILYYNIIILKNKIYIIKKYN